MHVRTCLMTLVFLAAAVSARAADVKLNGQTFRLPDGYSIELAAGPPGVDRPICAAFDERGRLYVADSSGSNEPLEKQLEEKPHRIVRLEDSNGDGRYDRSVVFVERIMFPEGTMWLDGSLYVSAPPSIWKLTDTTGDGNADRQEEWFQGKTLTHCGNDLHGPYLGPDGWVYWCKGAYAKQTYERAGKEPFTTSAAHIFRCRADAPRDPKTGSVLTSAIEPVMTGGMANPVDVEFTAGGERIFTTTFLVRPGGGLRDGLIHAVYGGVYGQQRGAINGHVRTGPLMPVLEHLGAAAPCGLTRYRSQVLGEGFQDNLFTCLFNMHKVTRHALKRDGAMFTTKAEDFVVSDNLDFHPTDVLEDADGSLVVVDTGGWYKICCPTSQLEKPDVKGAIYRIRRDGAPPVDDPRGLSLNWSSMAPTALAGLLADARPAVQDRAMDALARRGGASVEALSQTLAKDKRSQARLNAVWSLTRIDNQRARVAVRAALGDADETVRQAALHSISVRRDAGAVGDLLAVLETGTDANRRAAAEALGRIGDASVVPALLSAAGRASGRALEHSVMYALVEIGKSEPLRQALDDANPRTRRAALIALDQMPDAGLEPRHVVGLLSSDEPVLRDAADWIVDRHSEWAGDLVGYFEDQLERGKWSAETRRAFQGRLARFATDAAVRKLLADSLAHGKIERDSKQIVLRAMASSGQKQLPSEWADALTRLLQRDEGMLIREAVSVVRAIPTAKKGNEALTAALLAIGAGGTQRSTDVRLTALAAVPGGLSQVEFEVFTFAVEHLDQEQPAPTRSAAADVLVRGRLTSSQLATLAGALPSVSPLDIDKLLKAFDRSSDPAVGLALVSGLKRSSARSALQIETLKPHFAKYPQEVTDGAEGLYELLETDTAEQRDRLETLLATLPTGDVRRGQAVFHGTKAACAACHALGYLGGNVGPDLTRIAKIRNKRDLLEAIAFPSVSLVRSYEPVAIVTEEGKIYNGLVRREDSEELVLVTGANEEVRIPQDAIDERRASTVSIMPAGLDQQLTLQQLADLLEFLLTRK